jgi:hypothetical protein
LAPIVFLIVLPPDYIAPISGTRTQVDKNKLMPFQDLIQLFSDILAAFTA